MRSREFVLESTNSNKSQQFIDQVYSQYPDWPYGQADRVMVWGEGEDQQFAAFKLKPGVGANTVEIDWIMAGPEQRKGVGSRAVQELQRQAREAGIRLTLYPWNHGQISQAALTRFYKRNGFKPIAKGAKPMSWSPLDEAFDQPYRLVWEKGDFGDLDAYTTLPDGTNLDIMFNQEDDDNYTIEFWRDYTQRASGEGDSQRIFATVLSAIQKFLSKKQPKYISFTAEKERTDGNQDSRVSLYTKLLRRYAGTWGYAVRNVFDKGPAVTFDLVKIKPDDSSQQSVPLDEVVIDNNAGAGAVPNNSNVDYMGLRVAMRPSTFLQLAAPLSTEPDPGLLKYIANGGAIGAPFLQVSIPEAWDTGDFSEPAQVDNHEGRNRMHAIQKLEGDDPVEVHIFPRYYRARDMTPEFVKNLNSHLQVERSQRIKQGPLFTLLAQPMEEAINEAPLPGDWDQVQMNKGNTFKARLAYALQRAKKLGTGSSRVAMIIEYEGRSTVLKVAKNKKGLAQNAAEASILGDGYAKQLGILIPMIDYDDKNTEPYWIHTELAQKVNETTLCSLLKCDQNLEELIRIARTISGTTKYPVNLTKLALDYSLQGKSKQDIDTLFEYGEIIAELILSYDITPGDLSASANWGIYQGKPVIIDIGLTDNVWKQLYLKQKI